jgi:hypothetical protein
MALGLPNFALSPDIDADRVPCGEVHEDSFLPPFALAGSGTSSCAALGLRRHRIDLAYGPLRLYIPAHVGRYWFDSTRASTSILTLEGLAKCHDCS